MVSDPSPSTFAEIPSEDMPPDSHATPTTRQYRSQKRQKPCDRCRERKLKCRTEGEPPCQRCRENTLPCTYLGRPRRRASMRVSGAAAVLNEIDDEDAVNQRQFDDAAVQYPPLPESTETPLTPQTARSSTGLGAQSCLPPSIGSATPVINQQQTQLSQTLDQIAGHSAQLFGTSSESDPWLLRHCRFDEFGLRAFHKVHFRNPGGLPTNEKIPVHFILSADELAESVIGETRTCEGKDFRAELNHLVPPEYGARLIRMFHKHVFPVLPIVSRTHFHLHSVEDIPSQQVLETVPTILLAAIYGSALPYSLNDEQLAPLSVYRSQPLDEIWRIVYDLFQEEIHTPRLSALQAGLLYLHKTPQDQFRYASSDTPFTWSFVGALVGLAHSLGLHLECRMMGIPGREKRLRRRLWWAVYVEDKMRSLLSGKPAYIHPDEWDVGELEDLDFEASSSLGSDTFNTKAALPFQDMAHLAVIAESIQTSLYSLRACQKLAEDLPASIQIARPLFERLNAWRTSLPISQPHILHGQTDSYQSGKYPTSIFFTYLTLVVYVWRALLRPTVRSLPPPQIIDIEQPLRDPPFFFEDISWAFSDLPEIELNIDEDVTDSSATINELHQAAQSCAGNLVSFTRHLCASHFSEFWYAWSRMSFAVVSNFLLVLLVQAPNKDNALKAKQMLETWRRVIRDQSRVFPLMLLATTRLGAFYWAGLAETFCLPPHIQEILS